LSSFKRSALATSLLLVLTFSVGAPSYALPIGVHEATTKVKALTYLNKLTPKQWASHTGYARKKFSSGWGKISMQGHTCDLRNYVLTRDLTNITRSASNWCYVTTGVLNDPYTGTTINFVRGTVTSNAVQIDHVVALSNAWSTGAQNLTSASRYSLANDPMNLLAVDGPTNGSKSDSDAASFLPRLAYQCKYVARQLAVKKKYKLWVTSAEKTAMASVLATCPNQYLPTK
jgi:hypothetical protein